MSLKNTVLKQEEDESMEHAPKTIPNWLDEFLVEPDLEDEEEEDPKCPVIKFPAEEILWGKWRSSLIVKILGKRIGFHYLSAHLRTLWAKWGAINIIDLANDFYIVKFTNDQDFDRAVSGGPYIIADHYLAIRPWIPYFDPCDTQVQKTLTWVRFPGLPIEYYNDWFMTKVASLVGKVHHVDKNTLGAERGKFGRVCIEVDLAKPLLSKFKLHRKTYGIEHEGLHNICSKCHMHGHNVDFCHLKMGNADTKDSDIPREDGDILCREEVLNDYGRWMIPEGSARIKTEVGWKKPSRGWVKLNTDGSRNRSGIITAGGVIRDWNGDWVAGFVEKIGIGTSFDAELWGLHTGIDLARHMGVISRLEVESDNADAITAIKGKASTNKLVIGIQKLCLRSQHITLRHIFREQNRVADGLAKLAHDTPLATMNVLYTPPDAISHFVLDDNLGVCFPRLIPDTGSSSA